MEDVRELYLDLIKKCLTNWIYGSTEMRRMIASTPWKRKLIDIFNKVSGVEIVRPSPMQPDKRMEGADWPPTAHTMVGIKRLDNIQFCVENVLSKRIPGDLIECGVWRGGSVIFMRALLKAHDIHDRVVYVADSFKGCPKPNVQKYPQDKEDVLFKLPEIKIPLEEVKANFDSYGLLDKQVCFIEGWFKDTLSKPPFEKLAILRLDADLYESTTNILVNIYSKLSVGGYLIVDDFNLPACKQAILDYRNAHGISDKIIQIDRGGVYWEKS